MTRKKVIRQKSHSIDQALGREWQNNLKIRLQGWKNGEILLEPNLDNISNELFEITNDQIIFPMGLSSAYRRYIHITAMELQLFHCSIGENMTRQIIVSRKLPIITPTEQINPLARPSIEFKSNIIHQYFTLTPSERLYRQSLVGVGLNADEMEMLHNNLQQFRSNNITTILNYRSTSSSTSSSIYPYDDLSHSIGVDYDPFGSNSSFLHITTLEQLHEICQILTNSVNHEIAFDLEMNNNFVYHGCTCLIQISCKTTERYVCGIDLSLEKLFDDEEVDFDSSFTSSIHEWYDLDIFIDPMYLPWKDIASELFPIFTNPSIVKVCHGARNGDVKALYRDFGIVIVNGFDTQEAWRYLGEQQLGLANILMKLRAPGSGWESNMPHPDGEEKEIIQEMITFTCNQYEGEDYQTIKQRLSQADWTQRPLPHEMIRYGRMDVRYLLPLYHILIRKLSGFTNNSLSLSLSVNESMEIDIKEKVNFHELTPTTTDMNASQVSIYSDLDQSTTLDRKYSFSFSEQPSPSSIKLDAIDQIFSITLSNSSELWSPIIPNIQDKTSVIKMSSLKNKYEAFRRKSKSKTWKEQNTHVFMRLVQWRERVGYIVNEAPVYICPTSLLLTISAKLPKTSADLHIMYNPLPTYVQPEYVPENEAIENILTVIEKSLIEFSQLHVKPVQQIETIAEMDVSISSSSSTTTTATTTATTTTVDIHEQVDETHLVNSSEVIIEHSTTISQVDDEESNQSSIPHHHDTQEITPPITEGQSTFPSDTSLPVKGNNNDQYRSRSDSSSKSESQQSMITISRQTLMKFFGVIITIKLFGYFFGGVSPFPLISHILLPSFCNWTLRWRNMKR